MLYQQTTAKLSSLLANGSTDKKTIYKLAINAQRLRIIPSFDNGICEYSQLSIINRMRW